MQCACAILSSVAGPALQYFSTLSNKQHNLQGGGKLLNIKCVVIFSTTSVWNIYILQVSEIWSQCILVFMQCSHYSVQILMKFEFSNFKKIFKYKISWKSVQWQPSCSMQMDTDGHDKVNTHFSWFCKCANRLQPPWFLPNHSLCKGKGSHFFTNSVHQWWWFMF
jgi:hypothetical protein